MGTQRRGDPEGASSGGSYFPVPPYPLEPAPCPACGGRGVIGPRDEFGVYDGCPTCEGTGIDPDDPASPL